MDCTPELFGSCRGDEIRQWLTDNAYDYNIENFVILDDEADMAEFTDKNLVQTDTNIGLQKQNAIECIMILK